MLTFLFLCFAKIFSNLNVMPPQPIIAHFDIDAFFVSVERLYDHTLNNKPLIVGGHNQRGVVSACSYEARKFGVHSAMPMKTAMRLCPQAIVLQGNSTAYRKYSKWVTHIIATSAPLFEKASIDEFYIELTGMDKYFDVYQWILQLRQKIIQETKLPISCGLSSNKMIAKIATDEAKPNGYLFIPFGKEKEFLAPLMVNKIPGVGTKTVQVLNKIGIYTIGQLACYDVTILENVLHKYGRELWLRANGLYYSEIKPYREAKSISTENTFEEDTNNMQYLHTEIIRMVEKLAYTLRKENKTAGCVTIKIRYPNFTTINRQATIPYTYYDDELAKIALSIFEKIYNQKEKIRLLGVRLSNLTDNLLQKDLFNNIEKKNELYKAVDAVKNKFGKQIISKASTRNR